MSWTGQLDASASLMVSLNSVLQTNLSAYLEMWGREMGITETKVKSENMKQPPVKALIKAGSKQRLAKEFATHAHSAGAWLRKVTPQSGLFRE